MVDESTLRSKYEAAGQGHVFNYWSKLTDDEKNSLLEQLDSIEVERIAVFLKAALADHASAGEAGNIKPFSKAVAIASDESTGKISKAKELGMQAIHDGKVGALVLAGGQGTRLGFSGPKGMYNIGLPSGRTLFQMVAERIRKLCQLASTEDKTAKIPFYIMTSPINHNETIRFFRENSNFGLSNNDLHFFEQGMLPCLTDEGRIIMESSFKVAMAPDGNGGIYPSLVKSGCLDEMKQRGLSYLHVFSIDNAMVKPADPIFIGHCIAESADCGNKVLWKSEAHEKVGVLAEKDGKPCIVEYSEISKEMAEMTDVTGRLVYGAANICNHFYTIDFINNIVVPNLGNLYHIARKKIPYYDAERKTTVTPDDKNGIKLESFIFDVFPLSKTMAVLDVDRSEEFAPVKNAAGSPSDSPDTARAMISALSKKWVVASGGNLTGTLESICEIAPQTSYAGEGLAEAVQGKEVECPFSL